MTTFWLADNLALIGRDDEAREVFERLRALSNDVGLFVGGVRPEGEAHARQLPAGVLAPRVRHLGRAPLDGGRVTDLAAVPRGLTTGQEENSWQPSTTTS